MDNRLRQYWYEMKSSFWFVPGLIIMAAIVLAFGLIKADAYISREVVNAWPSLLGSGADSSRGLLETIAGSMIAVAGVVFSITLVALSLASSQYSSRVLRTFMHDRTTQVVLGMFVGIFAYCLVVLRTIRDTDEGTFVPALAVLFGLLLGFVGIVFLIVFIHHVAISIQASRIVAAVFDETAESIDSTFTERLDGSETGVLPEPTLQESNWHDVPATQTGFIQQIDFAPLLRFARENDAIVRLEQGIGEFLVEGIPAVSVLAPDPPDDTSAFLLNSAFTVGRQRTVNQDAAFGIRQLVDVAMKALSPGINDTTTAVMCIHYLTALLVRLANRRIEFPFLAENGKLRLLLRGPTYAGLAGEAFNEIRLHGEGNTAILIRLLESLKILFQHTRNADRRRVLLKIARDIRETADRSIASPTDHRQVTELAEQVIATGSLGEHNG